MANYKIEFSPLAQKEIEEAFNWYETEVVGLGERFVNAIDDSLIKISANPELFPQRITRYREYVVNVFPYIIVYEIIKAERTVNILHIFHTSRNPKLKYKGK